MVMVGLLASRGVYCGATRSVLVCTVATLPAPSHSTLFCLCSSNARHITLSHLFSRHLSFRNHSPVTSSRRLSPRHHLPLPAPLVRHAIHNDTLLHIWLPLPSIDYLSFSYQLYIILPRPVRLLCAPSVGN